MDEWTSLIERDRIERYAESFHQLAEIFRQMPEKKERLSEEDIEEMFETVKENICAQCGRRTVLGNKGGLQRKSRCHFGGIGAFRVPGASPSLTIRRSKTARHHRRSNRKG